MFKAIATVRNGARAFDVTIYSGYETIKEALDGVARFAAHGYYIECVKIEREE